MMIVEIDTLTILLVVWKVLHDERINLTQGHPTICGEN